MGALPGVAIYDHDNDGDLDIFAANGGTYPNGLLRNDGDGKFTNIAAQAGVDGLEETHGAAAADMDNDGDLDLAVATVRKNYLYLNNGDGTYTDIAASAGFTSTYFSSSVAWADINSDGFVDLYIGGADVFNGAGTNELFLNNGDLTFTNITAQTATQATYSWAVAFCDYDNDGDQDIFTANDQGIAQRPEDWSPVILYRNDGNLKFTDVTREAGLGLTGSWMGLAFADYDLDGDFDFFVTNIGQQFKDVKGKQEYFKHAFFSNNGNGTFSNLSDSMDFAHQHFGWGAVFLDFDNDMDSDLYYVGNFAELSAFDNPGHLFQNNGNNTFTDVTDQYGVAAVDASGTPTLSVGVATGDLNDDGHVDLVVANGGWPGGLQSGKPLLLTERHDTNNWLKLKLEGTLSNRAAIGAKVQLTAGGVTQIQEVASGISSFSQSSLWLTFGLGTNAQAEEIQITWPSGIAQTLRDVQANQTVSVVEERINRDLGDFNGDTEIDFSDFIVFIKGFGKKLGDEGYNDSLDLDEDDTIDFGDFVLFASVYGL